MKNDHHDIDPFFNPLDEYASEVPDYLFDNIMSAREEKEKRKGFWWWKLGVGIFILAMLIPAGIYLLNESDETAITIPSTDQEPSSRSLLKSGLPTESDLIVRDKSLSNTSSSSVFEEKETSPAAENTLSLTNIEAPKNNLTTKNITPDLHYQMNTTAANRISGIDNRSTESVLKHTEDTKKEEAVPDTDLPDLTPDQPKADQLKENIAVPEKLPIAPVPALPVSLPEMNMDVAILKGKGPRGCYSFAGGRIKYDYYVDGFVAPEYVLRTLTAKDAEHEDYRKAREDTERTMYGVSSGVRLSVVTRRGLAVRTGLVYNQTIERLQIDEEDSTIETFTVINGSTDTTRVVQTGRRIKKTYNRYRSFDIPLLLGYEVDSRNFIFNLNAGVYFNVLAKQKGEILSQANEPMFINSNNPQRIQAFSKDLGISVYGSFGFNYKMRNGFQLLIEPNLRYQLKPITLEAYPLEQQYIHMGLLVGLRKQF